MNDLEVLAKGLTKAQRALMLEPMPSTCSPGYRPANILANAGIIRMAEGAWGETYILPTELGVKLRNHLLQDHTS